MASRSRSRPKPGRSFWLSAANFYMLAAAVAIAAFFLTLGLLREERGEQPWIPAGVAASAVLVGAVILRRYIVRKAQLHSHAIRRLEQNWLPVRASAAAGGKKLSIERNSEILRELTKKSDAAMILEKYSEGHREVYQLCTQYLEINLREMKTVGPGSPRIAALRRGRQLAEEFHRRHLLKWAEVESRTLLEEAQNKQKPRDKVDTAGKALSVLNTALAAYPLEQRLSESFGAVSEYIMKVKVADLVTRADRAVVRGNTKQAERLYKSALGELNSDGVTSDDRTRAIEKIETELGRLRISD